MNCIPCRVRFGDHHYRILKTGIVYRVSYNGVDWESVGEPLSEPEAKPIRAHASRLRRNRNQRERSQAMRDLGMKKTPYGWE